ncbi:hypothetical protein [Marinomonas transparens]|uniref:Uncharacterized protein n=1 Tax=Marinomonas transparens TaxID=2795388 RepID=A0A934N5B1_9GAMM|nr:hypothetical protein [Marinomonas transparens]MBJ7536861.1 hypothetical protein [Marinomonas transparens]
MKFILAMVVLLSSSIASAGAGSSKIDRVGINSVGQLYIDLQDNVVQDGCFANAKRLLVPVDHAQLDRWFSLALDARIYDLPIEYSSNACTTDGWSAWLDTGWFQITYPESND